jgi:hypothetical protein
MGSGIGLDIASDICAVWSTWWGIARADQAIEIVANSL